MIIDKPWGYELIVEQNDKYVMKKLYVESGQRLSLQYHEFKHETMYCIDGEGFLHLGAGMEERTIALFPGSSHTIPPGTIHRLQAAPYSHVTVLEASTSELDDVIRIEDDYAR